MKLTPKVSAHKLESDLKQPDTYSNETKGMQIEKIPEKISEEDEKEARFRPQSSQSRQSDNNMRIPSKGIYLD